SKIISDWDDTITQKDTISLIFNVLPKSTPYPLSHFFGLYMDMHNQYMEQILPLKTYKDRNSIEKEICVQKDLKQVERSSLDEAIKLKVFQGYSVMDFESQVEQVSIKNGFVDFYNALQKNECSFNVLSVNWTGLIIRKFFNSTFKKQPDQILTNEFEFEMNGVCTGNCDPTFDIRTGYDKLLVTKELLNDSIDGSSLYIGDSSTDILSMIYCTKAIIMKGGSASSKLRDLGF
ncbi:hypothetical protein CANARDRAFT_189825, partial [[Candida] arabinofermentans NRRL YB-2248]